ncbi:thiopeptide-type bacteriocin biosynthesis protein [Saccharothrix australiensis]|uniref:Thiopeptide-type bacteriocin biosynthesis protein n=1 Tax=Saccharothrix australiensis TaxID=2072 RepID=A0A495W202_9PSEU|nr:thiopeptide-type bacteriocin biosynthesis protein [Saccharothrix australiensis]RKT54745.1 thiopeptide-type bacteriocin biosynthesis protein [Saccharothrix australiensis]
MTWTGLHVRVSWRVQHVDAFVADVLAPAMAEHRAAGRISDWFFIRYWQAGPHLRVRLRDAAGHADAIAGQLRCLVAAQDHPEVAMDPEKYHAALGVADEPLLPHGDVRAVPYEPEVERYGGPEALPIAEEVFCRSTDVAVAVLTAARTPQAKLSAAVELVMATTSGLGLDRPAAASWLRGLAASWRMRHEPATAPTMSSHLAAHRLHAARAAKLSARWDRVETAPTGAVEHWVRQLRADLPRGAWASQLHMLLNRLGVGPDEERLVCWLVAATALAPSGVAGFHADGADAPDRRYLEASKYRPEVDEQRPRKDHTRDRAAPRPGRRVVRLPEPPDTAVTLREVLRDRRTGRGDALRGPLDAARLAALLWTAHGRLPDGRRPHPSAGALYTARLRLVAWSVDGLEPGLYDVDEDDRRLVAVAPAPPVEDVTRTASWFGPGAVRGGGVDLATTPALLGLYARVGELRRDYGLRAARLGFTEAGHLAQNLALVAAGLSLSLGMVGGFYDDLAHDVLLLDGVDDTLVYLLPVGSC